MRYRHHFSHHPFPLPWFSTPRDQAPSTTSPILLFFLSWPPFPTAAQSLLSFFLPTTTSLHLSSSQPTVVQDSPFTSQIPSLAFATQPYSYSTTPQAYRPNKNTVTMSSAGNDKCKYKDAPTLGHLPARLFPSVPYSNPFLRQGARPLSRT